MTRSALLADLINIPQATIEKSLTMSTEAIAHQVQSPFFKEMVKKLSSVSSKSSLKDWYALDLDQTIEKYTGMKFKVKFEPIVNAYVFCPDLTANHIFSMDVYDHSTGDDAIKLAQKKLKEAGEVNLKTGRVSGIFSKLEISWCLGTELFEAGLTADEVAAVAMHEIGHAFTTLEFAAELYTTNVIAHAMVTQVMKTSDVAVKMELIQNGYQSLGIDIDANEAKALADCNDEKVVYVDVVTKRRDKRISATGTITYDSRSCEAAADQFAARQGAGEHLAKGLYKIFKMCGDEAFHSSFHYNFASAMTYLFTTWLSLAVPVLGIIIILLYFSSDPLGGVYDTSKDRIARIKRELIDASKNLELDKEYRKSLERQIQLMEQMDAEMLNHKSFQERLFSMFSKRIRQQRARMTTMQLIEEMANNRLFSSANSLFHRGE